MNADQFREAGKQMVDYIADHFESIRSRAVLPDVQPFYLQRLLPDQAPEEGEPFQKIFEDIERLIMPGVSLALLSV